MSSSPLAQVSQRKYPEAVLLARHNPPTTQSSRSLRSHHSPADKTYDNKEMKIINDNKIRRVAEIQIFEKTYLIVIKDETGLKFKMNDSTLFLIGSYAQKLVASY